MSKCSLLFRTPTELKGNPSHNEVPFGVLFARVRDRVGILRSLYGEGPLPIDFHALSDRANLVRTVTCDLQYRDVWRRSSRTGAIHGIGGVEGSVDYEGDLTEFLPYLHAAWWTGVGRHTVWGNGVIEVAHAEEEEGDNGNIPACRIESDFSCIGLGGHTALCLLVCCSKTFGACTERGRIFSDRRVRWLWKSSISRVSPAIPRSA